MATVRNRFPRHVEFMIADFVKTNYIRGESSHDEFVKVMNDTLGTDVSQRQFVSFLDDLGLGEVKEIDVLKAEIQSLKEYIAVLEGQRDASI